MSRTDDLRLLDILEASDRIGRLVARGREAFDDDEALQPAVERMLEIIGESANNLSEDTRRTLRGIEWEDLRRLRIVLAHHYIGSIRIRSGPWRPGTFPALSV